MQTNGIEKSKIYSLVEIIDYVSSSVVSKTIFRKITGKINIMAIDANIALEEKILPFDMFIQIIEEEARIVTDDKSEIIQTGQCIIVPAHTAHIIKAEEKVKLISTVIKSGYEDISI
ncbi:MAG: hypothetical protein PHH93_14000 [Prolixibacteraceae bacterium]|nr:hypothetical protein [Prolixibacteraceae bacterium]